jgi:putative oxidoreductase
MKKIFNVSTHNTATDTALLVARIGIAVLMLTHGLPKLMMLLSGAPVQFPPLFGLSAQVSLSLAVFAEVFCSILILFGLGTRLALIPLMVTMLVAALMIHGTDPFAKQEPSLQYLLVYTVLLLTGAGRFSMDYVLQRRMLSTTKAHQQIRRKEMAY